MEHYYQDNVDPTARPLAINVDYKDALMRCYDSLKDAIQGRKKLNDLGLLEGLIIFHAAIIWSRKRGKTTKIMGGLGCLYIPYDSMFCTWKGKDETGEIFVLEKQKL